MNTRSVLLCCGLLLLAGLMCPQYLKRSASPTPAAQLTVPGEHARCPVCGMWVAPHADWMSTLRFKDGQVACFDGVKDMFKYRFNLQRYEPSRTVDEIQSITVTDYYSLKPVDAHLAHFVLGSDVLGPMGRELIPFASESAAQEFQRDHHGQAILSFAEVRRDTIAELD